MRSVIAFLVALLLLPGAAMAAAQSASFREGVDFKHIEPEQPTASGKKIEVIEVFWYGCPHCFHFQPYIEQWAQKLPADVDYVRMPAVLNASWETGARAYYTAEALGVLDRVHEPIYDAIHEKRQRLTSEGSFGKFFAGFGVDEQDFHKTFNSFAVDSKVRRAQQMTRRYRIEGTPSVVINGRWLTGPGMTGSYEKLLQVMDFLIAKERGAT